MTREMAKQMLDEASAACARGIRLHPDTIDALRRDFPQDPTVPSFVRPAFGIPIFNDPMVEPGKWVFDL